MKLLNRDKAIRGWALVFGLLCLALTAALLIVGCGNPHNNTINTAKFYVGDFEANRVLVYPFPSATNESATVVLGQPDFTSSTHNLTAAGLYQPAGVVSDGSGNVYVADLSNNRVLKYAAPLSNGMSATVVFGEPDFTTGTSSLSQSGMNAPSGVALDHSGNLWVADYINGRVLEFVPPFSNGMNASVVVGQPNFTTHNNAPTQNGLADAFAITFDSSGNLWVADTVNDRVLEFTKPFSNGMNASLVLGQANFTTSTGATTQSGMSIPAGVAFDKSGNLWVADYSNNRVLEFTPPFSNGMNAAVVLGQPNFTSSAAATTQASLTRPVNVTFDSKGTLYVADSANCRTLTYAPPFTTGMNATTAVGEPDFTTGCSGVVNATATGETLPYGAATGP